MSTTKDGNDASEGVRVLPLAMDDLFVISVPTSARDTPEPDGQADARASLTAAELEIAGLVLEGLSNAEIAARRGRALRTIANQVAAVLRKLGVRSRYGIAAGLTRRKRSERA